MKKELIIEHCSKLEKSEPFFADGFDDAIIGICENSFRVAYSKSKCIEILIKQDMSEEEAIEFLEYNTFGAYIGALSPILIEEFAW